MRVLRGLALFAVGVVLTLSACEADVGSPTAGCLSTRECPPRMVCRVPDHSCIPEPKDALIGSFQCDIPASETGKALHLGVGDLLATPAGVRLLVGDGVGCSQSSVTKSLLISAFQLLPAAETYSVAIALPAGAKAGRYAFVPATVFADSFSAVVFGESAGGTKTPVAYSAEGFVTLDVDAVNGKLLSGYVEARLRAVPEKINVSGSCPNGVVDCGASLSLICESVTDKKGQTTTTCTSGCVTDAECTRYGAICTHVPPAPNGQCLKQCTTDNDCQLPDHLCLDSSDPMDPRKTCF